MKKWRARCTEESETAQTWGGREWRGGGGGGHGECRARSAGDGGESILCEPAMQPLAPRYSVHLHKGDEGRGGGRVSVIDLGWTSGVSPAARPEPHTPLHNTDLLSKKKKKVIPGTCLVLLAPSPPSDPPPLLHLLLLPLTGLLSCIMLTHFSQLQASCRTEPASLPESANTHRPVPPPASPGLVCSSPGVTVIV